MQNKLKSNIILFIIIMIFLIISLIYVFFNNLKQKENNFVNNNSTPTGAYCIELIDDPNKCYQMNELTCQEYCTKSIWSQEDGKKFTKGEYPSSKQCKYDEFYNEKPVVSTPDNVIRPPGTIVVGRVDYTAGGDFKDAPVPYSICCCDK